MPALRFANSVRALAACVLVSSILAGISLGQSAARGDGPPIGNSTREARDAAIRAIPYDRLTPNASTKIRSIVEHASYFRRLPTETMECEPEMFTFLARNPDVMVNIWDVMGITRVTLQRIGQYQLQGNDGAGTTCKMDLIFGNDSTHIYHVTGAYKGPMWPKELQGQSIIMLHNQPAAASKLPAGGVGLSQMTVTMDVFLKLENIGADLVVRTLGPLVNKSADQNFIECVSFVGQISQVAATNPTGMLNLASRLGNIDAGTREQFVATTKTIAARLNSGTDIPLAMHQPSSRETTYRIEEPTALESNYAVSRVPPPDAIVSSSGQNTSNAPSGRPVSTRRSQGGIVYDEPAGDSPTLQLIHGRPAP